MLNYATVSKQLRDYFKKQSHKHDDTCKHDHDHDNDHHHMCGFNALTYGVGYDDLNEFMKNPCALDFIFGKSIDLSPLLPINQQVLNAWFFCLEIVKIEQPNEYTKESWALTDKEKIDLIPILKEEGNKFYNEKSYENSIEKYHLAISYLEQLMLK